MLSDKTLIVTNRLNMTTHKIEQKQPWRVVKHPIHSFILPSPWHIARHPTQSAQALLACHVSATYGNGCDIELIRCRQRCLFSQSSIK